MEANQPKMGLCVKARSRLCPMPRTCKMAKPHACDCKPGDCLLDNGRTMKVRCVEVAQAEGGAK